MIQDLILSDQAMHDRYRQLGAGFVHPYLIQLSSGHGRLDFIGADHSYNPDHPQFAVIRELWSNFIAGTAGEERILMVEGNPKLAKPQMGRSPYQSDIAAIRQDGEYGLGVYLASKAGVLFYSPEPDRKLEMETLAKQFGREALIYYYFARQAWQWHRGDAETDFQSYLQSTLDKYRGVVDWPDFDFSFNHLVRIHDASRDHPFKQDDLDCFKHDSTPGKNPVASGSSQLRDHYILSEIAHYWHGGKSLFILYGSGHAIKLEPALKELVQGKG